MQKTSHAIFNRIYVCLGLFAALVGGIPLASYAAYATLTPPPGWVAGGGAVVAGPGGSYAAQATANQWIANASKSSAMLNVGGKQQAVNVAMKLSPSAGKVAAAVLYLSPHLRTAAGIAAWLGVGKVVWDSVEGGWKIQNESNNSGFLWIADILDGRAGWETWHSVKSSACAAGFAYLNSTETPGTGAYNSFKFNSVSGNNCVGTRDFYNGGSIIFSDERLIGLHSKVDEVGTCPAGWKKTTAGCVSPALTQPEFVQVLNPNNNIGWPSPTTPGEFPLGTPFPIDMPVVNPDTGVNPFPKPLFVPTGQPVPNPNYNPDAPAGPGNQPWKQPGTTVTPRPVPGNPWQVDVQPTDREQGGPTPLPDTELNPDPNPDTDKPKPEEQQSLCEKHPDILACAKPELDSPDGDIPKSTRNVDLVEENLFGGGSCPADVYFAPHGLQSLKVWDWNQSCGYITGYVKPILLLCCTFSAFMILVPGRTE